VVLLSETALAASASSAWSGLWHTPDQQGQALLDAGQPAQAAERFHDPRRRAYADLEAGGYAGAAKLLAPFTDAQSEYNRGNALAKSGQLPAALAAYDSALKQAPADKDIRHNRDLVERALRQQQQQQRRHQSPPSSSRNGRQGDQAGTSQGQPQKSSTGQQGSSGSQHSGDASQQSRAGGSPSPGSDQAAASGSKAGANRPGDSGQAQREAADAAALAGAQRQRGPATNTGKTPDTDSLLAGGTQTPKPKPESERQMALDQWLRQIPDSPAGLLRRKFLIEHIIRQQDGGNSLESAP
jgi:Ca-activated chloride channel family protein